MDLRLLVAVLKMNNDLERIGDLAVNIARKAAAFADEPYADFPLDLAGMWDKTQKMLRDSIDALIDVDPRLAAGVCARDDEVDQMKRVMRQTTERLIRENPDQTGGMLKMLAVSRSLERIADCATNIAEDVIYMADGRIVRHRGGSAER